VSDPLLDPRDHDLEVELLRAGREVRMSAAGQARVLASLGIAVGGIALAGKAAASAGGTLTKLSTLISGKAALVAAGLVSVGAAGGGAWFASATSPEPVAPRVVEAPVVPVTEAKPERSEVSPEEAEAPNPEVEARPRAPAKAQRQAPSAPERNQAERRPGLGDELAFVESASRALRSGNPQVALGRLAEYRQRFPRGKLALEAQVLRIEALARAGRTSEAQRLARGFVKRYPNSPVAARIRRYTE
jgi:TolA-binding protein